MPETMTQADSFWLNMDEPTNLMVITGFWEFKEPLDFNRLYATVDARLASFPRFRKRVVRPRSGLWRSSPNSNLWPEDRTAGPWDTWDSAVTWTRAFRFGL